MEAVILRAAGFGHVHCQAMLSPKTSWDTTLPAVCWRLGLGTGGSGARHVCEITIDRAGMAALRLRCIANSALNKKSTGGSGARHVCVRSCLQPKYAVLNTQIS
jgi:hypothetical protein